MYGTLSAVMIPATVTCSVVNWELSLSTAFIACTIEMGVSPPLKT
jgi:hypothetical protein